MTIRLTRLTLAVLAALTLPAPSQAQFRAPVDTAKIAITTSSKTLAPSSLFKLGIWVTLRPGYHIAAPAKGAPAQLRVTAGQGITFKPPVFPVPVKKKLLFSSTATRVYQGKFKVVVPGAVAENAKPGSRTLTVSFRYQACAATKCYPPAEVKAKLTISVVKVKAEESGPAFADVASTSPSGGFTERLAGRLAGSSLPVAIVISFLLGLTLCLTPCVYPMIPITVCFFAGQGEGQKARVLSLAVAYVIGIAITYSALGVAASSLGLVIGAALQNPYVVAFIVLVFAALALSMFGLFEIRPPAFLMNRTGARSGVAGAFLMGLMVGVVVSPCVGPAVAGVALVVAQLKNPVLGFWVFFSLSLGLGLPFLVLGVFSGALSRLPIAGAWMVAVKRLSGVALLGMAAYFGRLLLPHPVRGFAVPVYLLAAAVYLVLFESSLKTAGPSRFIRPALALALGIIGVWSLIPGPRATMRWERYSPQALERAAASGRPVMIDFTAAWCGLCKDLEHDTFSNPRVMDAGRRFVRLRADFTRASKENEVLAKLYELDGLPTVVFIDSRGQEKKRARVIGFLPPNQFLKTMASVE